MATISTSDGDLVALSGRALRFVLVNELMSRRQGTTTVAQLVQLLAERGIRPTGRASKTISDSLRWEVRRGRVGRPARGQYRYCGAPPSTARRIRIFAQRCHAWIVAVMQGDLPPLTPPDPRAQAWQPGPEPHDPPWSWFGWLWVT